MDAAPRQKHEARKKRFRISGNVNATEISVLQIS